MRLEEGLRIVCFFSHFNTSSDIDLISDAWRTAEASGAAETRCTTVEFRAMTEMKCQKDILIRLGGNGGANFLRL